MLLWLTPRFSLVTPASGNSLLEAHAAANSKPKFSRWCAKHPVFWISRPDPLQWMPVRYTLPEFIASEATHRHSFTKFTSTSEARQVYLWNKLCIKERLNSWLQIKFWKGNNKQQKQLPVYLSLWDFSGAQKLRKQISSALFLQCYLEESASLLCFCPGSDSDSCWVASWVQMKYQIISWGLQFSFLLIF